MRQLAPNLVLGALLALVLAASAWVAFVPPRLERQDWRWGSSWDMTTTQLFTEHPREHVQLMDEEIYLGTLQGVRAGRDFYRAQHDVLAANPGRWDTHSPVTYRQPLLTQVWATIGNGGAIGLAWGALAALSMLIAFRVATRLVRGAGALLAPAALGLEYALLALHPPRLLFAEMWAGPLLVMAGALCALALLDGAAARRARGLASALGAVCALLALLVRELAIVPVAVMTLALVLDRGARARRAWWPWLAAAAVWAAFYALHAANVRAVSAADPPPAWSVGMGAMYVHPGAGFLSACVRWAATSPALVPVVALLLVLPLPGLVTLRGTGLRVLAAGLTAGVLALLVVSGTPGTYPDGSYTGYWGFQFLPLVLAWSPIGLRAFGQARDDQATMAPAKGGAA